MTIRDAKYIARLYILALAVFREARGEPRRGKKLVAETIRNRVEDSRWPDTYEKVILQPWQFSAFNKNDPNAAKFPGTQESTGLEDAAWLESLEVAQEVLGAVRTKTNANHYHAKSVKPRWSENVTPVAAEGNHLFFRL